MDYNKSKIDSVAFCLQSFFINYNKGGSNGPNKNCRYKELDGQNKRNK